MRHVHLIITMLSAVTLSACVTGSKDERAAIPLPVLAFPAPPDEARFIFERTLRSSADVNTSTSTDRLRRLVTGERETGRGFGKPFDVVACRGRIYVSDTVERVVFVFSIPENRFFEIGRDGSGALGQPLGLNVDSNCNLYVVDGKAKTVLVFDRDGRHISSVGGEKWLSRPSHVAPTADGSRIYAVDTGGLDGAGHRIRVFETSTGNHLFDIGGRGTEPGQFNLPRDAEFGADGLLYVVDGANFRVQVFEPDGTLKRTFGEVGRQIGQFSRPKGIALDKQSRVYVSDTAFGNFQIFDTEGQVLLFVGSRSSRPEPAKYMLPAGIDVDEDGRVYMVDQYFRKVDIYRPAKLAPDSGHAGSLNRTAAN